MSLIAVGALWLTQISATGTWAADVLGPSFVTALGMGMSFVPVTIAAVAGVPPERAGLASGLVNTSRQMGGALGLAVLTSLAASLTSDYVRRRTASRRWTARALVHGYQGAFLLGALLALPVRSPPACCSAAEGPAP